MVTQQLTRTENSNSQPKLMPRPRLAVLPARRELTADTIARIGAWAKAHDTSFSDLVYEWTGRGGLRALARHIERGDAVLSGVLTLPQGA